jgi:hypothetical protein
MLDTLIILFVSLAAMFVAYRAMAADKTNEAPTDPEASASGKRKPGWATERQRRSPRTKR